MLIVSLVLHQVKEVSTVTQKEINSECRTLAYIGIVLTILGLVHFCITENQNSVGCTFSNEVKIMVFISEVQNYTYKIMQNYR